jgi:hypothetical protein
MKILEARMRRSQYRLKAALALPGAKAVVTGKNTLGIARNWGTLSELCDERPLPWKARIRTRGAGR